MPKYELVFSGEADVRGYKFPRSGEQVGSALANVNNLEAGATWKYRAVSMASGGSKFKLGKISGW